MTHNPSVNFKLVHFLLWTKGSHHSSNFDTFESLVKVSQVPHVISKRTVIFSSNFASLFNVMKDNSSVLFFSSNNIYYFTQKEHIKMELLRLSSAQIKICQIPHVNSEMTRQFLFIFCILHCHDT